MRIRPYLSLSKEELLQLYKGNMTDKSILGEIVHELQFRDRISPIKKIEIVARLLQLLGGGHGPESTKPTPSLPEPISKPAPPVAPPGSSVWKVGKAYFLYDPSIQIEDQSKIILFSYSFDTPVKLDTGTVKLRSSETVPLSEEYLNVLDRYRNWLKFYRSELKSVESSTGPNTDRFLDSVQNGEVMAYWGRKAHCYQCKTSLAGKRGNICFKCFWIVCRCGACGCGWTPAYH